MFVCVRACERVCVCTVCICVRECVCVCVCVLCLFYVYSLSVLLLLIWRWEGGDISEEGKEDRVRLPGYLTDPDHIQNTENCIHFIYSSNIKMRHRIFHTQNLT